MKIKTLLLLICICVFIVALALRLAHTPIPEAILAPEGREIIRQTYQVSPNSVTSSGQSPPSNVSTMMSAVKQSKPITDEIRQKIVSLEHDVLVPIESVVADKELAYRQTSAIRQLAIMQIPEATAALAKILMQPEEKFFASGVTPDGGEWHSYSHQVMVYFYQTIEGVPAPANGGNYTTQDLPAFRQWWNQVNGRISYKKIAVRSGSAQ